MGAGAKRQRAAALARPDPNVLVLIQAGTALYFGKRLRRGLRFPKDKEGRAGFWLRNEILHERCTWEDRLAEVRAALRYFDTSGNSC